MQRGHADRGKKSHRRCYDDVCMYKGGLGCWSGGVQGPRSKPKSKATSFIPNITVTSIVYTLLVAHRVAGERTKLWQVAQAGRTKYRAFKHASVQGPISLVWHATVPIISLKYPAAQTQFSQSLPVPPDMAWHHASGCAWTWTPLSCRKSTQENKPQNMQHVWLMTKWESWSSESAVMHRLVEI